MIRILPFLPLNRCSVTTLGLLNYHEPRAKEVEEEEEQASMQAKMSKMFA